MVLCSDFNNLRNLCVAGVHKITILTPLIEHKVFTGEAADYSAQSRSTGYTREGEGARLADEPEEG